MVSIRTRDPHGKPGARVRRAACGEGVANAEPGRPVASVAPLHQHGTSRPFRKRPVLPEFEELPFVSGDATAHVSEDRGRR